MKFEWGEFCVVGDGGVKGADLVGFFAVLGPLGVIAYRFVGSES